MGIPDISTEALQVFTANEAFYWELVASERPDTTIQRQNRRFSPSMVTIRES